MGIRGHDTAERLFRRHVTEMRSYADEIEKVIGSGPIVKRIRSCSNECEDALDRLAKEAVERNNRAFENAEKSA